MLNFGLESSLTIKKHATFNHSAFWLIQNYSATYHKALLILLYIRWYRKVFIWIYNVQDFLDDANTPDDG